MAMRATGPGHSVVSITPVAMSRPITTGSVEPRRMIKPVGPSCIAWRIMSTLCAARVSISFSNKIACNSTNTGVAPRAGVHVHVRIIVDVSQNWYDSTSTIVRAPLQVRRRWVSILCRHLRVQLAPLGCLGAVALHKTSPVLGPGSCRANAVPGLQAVMAQLPRLLPTPDSGQRLPARVGRDAWADGAQPVGSSGRV